MAKEVSARIQPVEDDVERQNPAVVDEVCAFIRMPRFLRSARSPAV